MNTLKTLGLLSISVMSSESNIREVWRQADAVCFDVDSTVIKEEGIDELAKFCGKGEEVTRLTKEAMKGAMTFQEALKLRLNIINPSLQQIKEFIKQHPSSLTPGIKNLIEVLQNRGVPVYLVSGGFRCLIGPVAEQLGIPLENIFANRLKFFFNGDYAGFDENEPTSRTGGKGVVIKKLKDLHNYHRIVMIGDGATDLEASPPADAFIGFGGNVLREEVKKKSQWYVTDLQELVDSLAIQSK
ncbi:phosphoserine phosphatase isoform X2 [Arctopsyche grandis]